jgi:hypothetical protein
VSPSNLSSILPEAPDGSVWMRSAWRLTSSKGISDYPIRWWCLEERFKANVVEIQLRFLEFIRSVSSAVCLFIECISCRAVAPIVFRVGSDSSL